MADVSKELIAELQTIIREDYGKELTIAEVSQIANGLVGYFDLLGKMYHQDNEETQLEEGTLKRCSLE